MSAAAVFVRLFTVYRLLFTAPDRNLNPPMKVPANMSGDKTCLATALACLLLVGCSKQAKQDYSQAGQSLKQAAKATTQAVKTDVAVAGEKTKAAVKDIKKPADKDKSANHK